jgi:uncharacterized protein (TIGR02271 family)
MTTLQDVKTWRGMTAVDATGAKVGKIDEIYLDRASGEPEWATVKTGMFGSKSTFVPIQDANMAGDEVALGYTKDQIKDAPNIDADGELSSEEEQRLYRHYGRSDYGQWTGEDRTKDLGTREEREGRFDRESGTDDAMTRSEEELRVGKTSRETGRGRLRKYVVSEQVEKTVPVQREELRVEREPITDDNLDAALQGPDITESEHEVTLHAEEPVVEKRTVPKERVRLEKDTVTDEETVSDEVRKERIEHNDPKS